MSAEEAKAEQREWDKWSSMSRKYNLKYIYK